MYAGLFEEDGRLKAVGSHWSRPEYANTLQILADEGDEPFYSGRIAEDIVKVVQERGGLLNMKDMESESTFALLAQINDGQRTRLCGWMLLRRTTRVGKCLVYQHQHLERCSFPLSACYRRSNTKEREARLIYTAQQRL
jgi:hypothetical protein